MLGAISRVVMVFSKLLSKVALFSAARVGSTDTISSRFGSRWRSRSSFRLGASSQAPSTLPLFLSTRCTLREKSWSGCRGIEKVSTIVDAPSSCTSEASSSVSALPLLFSASAASWLASGFALALSVAADAAGAAACGLPLSSQPVNDSAVSSARDSAAKRNGFILLTPRPAGRIH